MLQMGILAALATGQIAKNAVGTAALAHAAGWAKDALEHIAKPQVAPKAEPVKPANDALANSFIHGIVALGFTCATEFAVGSIRNHLTKQAQ